MQKELEKIIQQQVKSRISYYIKYPKIFNGEHRPIIIQFSLN